MMDKRRFIYVGIAIFAISIFFTVFRRLSVYEVQTNQLVSENETASVGQAIEKNQNTQNTKSAGQISDQHQKSLSSDDSEHINSYGSKRLIALSVRNFERFVNECFKGENCILSEDPISMYRSFKVSGNHSANDNLISFLRLKMKNREYRKRYKETLKEMILDFYPPEERQFQEASYYSYLGDLQKSLDLYLDLENKIQSDTSLRPAPKLNIANTLYDLKRYKDSLPYYQAALEGYISREQQVAIPSQNDMIRFIEKRIEDVKKKF